MVHRICTLVSSLFSYRFIRIPLHSMLMSRCRAIQPKHNCALQASLLAHLYFVCAPPFLSSFPSRGFHSHSASLHAHVALSRYAAEAQVCFASQLARTLILRLRTARRNRQIVSYRGLRKSHFVQVRFRGFLVLLCLRPSLPVLHRHL